MATMLQRRNFQTSRLLEYFTEKELTLQTGHEPDRWPEVILKELLDNALDACETHGILPEIRVTTGDGAIRVQDNGPGLSADVVRGVIDFGVRVSSKDAYISPTRGAQGKGPLLNGPKVLGLKMQNKGARHFSVIPTPCKLAYVFLFS